MELLIGAALAGVALAVVVMVMIWRVVSRAVDNGLDWLIHTFGNDPADSRIEEKWRRERQG